MKTSSVILVIILIVLAVLDYKFYLRNSESEEDYEPQNMGSRRYWGFGRENAYGVYDHFENHGPCYQASQNEFRKCLPGYEMYTNNYTGRLECCVNASNY